MNVLLSATVLCDASGNFIMSRSTLYDITEIKKAQDALRKSESFIKNILESVGEGFIVVDRDFRIISANKAYCEQVKCRHENITGKYCYEVSHHLSRPCFMKERNARLLLPSGQGVHMLLSIRILTVKDFLFMLKQSPTPCSARLVMCLRS